MNTRMINKCEYALLGVISVFWIIFLMPQIGNVKSICNLSGIGNTAQMQNNTGSLEKIPSVVCAYTMYPSSIDEDYVDTDQVIIFKVYYLAPAFEFTQFSVIPSYLYELNLIKSIFHPPRV